jgi:hypothetical protein
MNVGDIVDIRSGMFASYKARVVAIHGDTFEAAVTMFGREGVVMFGLDALRESTPVADTRSRTTKVRQEYHFLRHSGVPHYEAVLEAALAFGFETFADDGNSVKAPTWVWQACAPLKHNLPPRDQLPE